MVIHDCLQTTFLAGLRFHTNGTVLSEFASEFECGNLHRAAMVDEHEYDLWLSPDTNVATHRVHTQWFFFRVR